VRVLLLTVVLAACGFRTGSAQWHLGLEFAAQRYRGSAHDTSEGHVASDGRPGGGPALGLRISKTGRRLGVGLRLAYANTGFAVSGNGVSIVDKTTGRHAEVAALMSTRVGGIGPSGAVWVELGPALHLWDFDGEFRTRTGAIGAAEYQWPVSSRFLGAIRVEGMLSPSWFDATDVPPEFERRVTCRYGAGLALRYRL
jgi:hypothetical protein